MNPASEPTRLGPHPATPVLNSASELYLTHTLTLLSILGFSSGAT